MIRDLAAWRLGACLLVTLSVLACDYGAREDSTEPVQPAIHYTASVKLTRDGVLVGELVADSAAVHPDSTAVWFYGAEATFLDPDGDRSGRLVSERARLEGGILTPYEVTARVGTISPIVADPPGGG